MSFRVVGMRSLEIPRSACLMATRHRGKQVTIILESRNWNTVIVGRVWGLFEAWRERWRENELLELSLNVCSVDRGKHTRFDVISHLHPINSKHRKTYESNMLKNSFHIHSYIVLQFLCSNKKSLSQRNLQ